MMENITGVVADVVLYAGFLTGLLLLYGQFLSDSLAKFRAKRRLRERKRQMKEAAPWRKHLDNICNTSINVEGKYLIIFITIVFCSVLFVAIRNLSTVQSLLLSAMMAAMPYVILRIRFETLRRKGSMEGEALISSFLNQYRISNFNVYEALERMLYEEGGTKRNNPLILKLLLELRSTGNPSEIKKAVNRFAEIINTNWSRMFAYNIQLAAEKGINVSLAVEDIIMQLRDARVLFEERKRLNSEAMRIVVYMIPFLYFFTVVMSLRFIGLSPMNYIQNQFFTKEGFLLLTVSSALFLINIALMEIVTKQRFDY